MGKEAWLEVKAPVEVENLEVTPLAVGKGGMKVPLALGKAACLKAEPTPTKARRTVEENMLLNRISRQ